jgi:hypothetical protein
MMNHNMESIKKRFLSFCSDEGWADLLVLPQDIKRNLPNLKEDEIRETTLTILQDLVKAGLIEIGELGERKGEGFIPWKSSTAEGIQRIRDEWIKFGQDPLIEYWGNLTQKGLDLVRSWEKKT